ncbi:MAG: DNA-binding response regulator [Clostridiales bacterium]|jgi:DNA-binding NarL/FixJ family response regulator|nr:DNA-binding response regulator [Clostridiales bacterium]
MKIILIDDHPLVRKGLAFVLALEDDMEVIGEASNIKEAIEIIKKQQPDVVLVDLRLGNEYGLDIIEKSKKNSIISKFIVLTSSADEQDFRRAEEVGAHGYVLKEALPEELLYAVRLVYNGRKYYDPGILEEMMKVSSQEGILDVLSPREQEVLIELGKGLCNKDIAKKLFITEYTVKKHVSQVLAKLELTDRTQAALYAFSKGFTRVG